MQIQRRDFLRAAAASAAACAFPNLRASAASPNGKVNMAFVGIGHQAAHDFSMFAYYKDLVNVVALCDTQMGASHTQNVLKEYPNVPRYQDFRKMLDEHAAEIDAVCVATPDFSHFPAAMLAMSMGKAVYCEKPMCNCFREIALMTAAAKRHKVVTQMGNQGHSDANYWQMKALVESGAIKDVTKVNAFMCANNRRWFKWKGTLTEMPGEEAEPAEMDWGVWLSQRPFRPYNHNFINGDWRCFYEYGTGALGDWGAHIFDAAHEFLQLGLPSRIETVKNDRRTPVVYPMASTIRYVFPARGPGLPECTLEWSDGAGNFPALPEKVTDKKWRRKDYGADEPRLAPPARRGRQSARPRGEEDAQGLPEGQERTLPQLHPRREGRGEGEQRLRGGRSALGGARPRRARAAARSARAHVRPREAPLHGQ